MAKQPKHGLSQWAIQAMIRRLSGQAACLSVPANSNGTSIPTPSPTDVQRERRDHDSPPRQRPPRRSEWDE
jgi:hypothetical protein